MLVCLMAAWVVQNKYNNYKLLKMVTIYKMQRTNVFSFRMQQHDITSLIHFRLNQDVGR